MSDAVNDNDYKASIALTEDVKRLMKHNAKVGRDILKVIESKIKGGW